MPEDRVVSLDRFIIEQERLYPEATGRFSNILYDIALAAKVVTREVRRAGITDILGRAGRANVYGEDVTKLDNFANNVFIHATEHSGNICIMASEENKECIEIPPEYPVGNYALLMDPLDGSSNIDVNVAIGTIFSIHRKVSAGPRGAIEDCLQPGRKQLAAGYVVYGSSTMLVYTTGSGVHGFTLDPTLGEFILSHRNIRIPERSAYISANESNYTKWPDEVRSYVDHIRKRSYSSRYIGSLVADFHRNLLKGGMFMYPPDQKSPSGKLRLLYEAAPLGFVIEQAGGYASDGNGPILDIQPEQLHQRVPLYIGSPFETREAEAWISGRKRPGIEPAEASQD
jgi:fructose-1,6-bisphosphatase I